MDTTIANQRQVGGAHYSSAYQHWDFAHIAGLGYFEGQITKYLARHGKKNGLEDLEKALHFTQKLLSLAEDSQYRCMAYKRAPHDADEFCESNGITGDNAAAIRAVVRWRHADELRMLLKAIRELTEVYTGNGPTADYVDQG